VVGFFVPGQWNVRANSIATQVMSAQLATNAMRIPMAEPFNMCRWRIVVLPRRDRSSIVTKVTMYLRYLMAHSFWMGKREGCGYRETREGKIPLEMSR